MTDVYVMLAAKDGEREASGVYGTKHQAEAALIAFAQQWAERYGDVIGDDLDACEDYLMTEAEVDYWIFAETVDNEESTCEPASVS